MKIKNIKVTILLISCLLAGGCNLPPNDQETLTGHWQMHQVFQIDVDVSQEHNPGMDRYIILSQDGLFESGGSPYGKNTGSFEYDGKNKTLFIDSDAGEDDDSRWKVEIAGDTMKWEGIGSDYARSFRLVHVRKER